MALTYSGSFAWAAGGKAGATVTLWAASRFATPPEQGSGPPDGNPPDGGPVTSGPDYGNPGGYTIEVPLVQDYYQRIEYGSPELVAYWGVVPAGQIAGQSSGGSAGQSILVTQGMTPTVGAYNQTQGALNAAIFANNIAIAIAESRPLQWGPGTWDLYGQLYFNAPIPCMFGVGVDMTLVRHKTGRGWVQGHTPSSSTALPYTPITADGTTQAVSTGFVLGNNTGNYSGPGGWVHDMTFITADAANGLTPCGVTVVAAGGGGTTDPVNTPSNVPAVCVNGVTQMDFERVRFHGWGCGADFVNNCGGSTWRNVTADYGYNNCALNLRSTGESGSDFPLYDAWLHGSIVAVAITGGTDYHFTGGQLSANQGATGFATAEDFVAPFWVGRNFIDGGIGSDGMPGIIPTPGTGGVGLVDIDKCDFEGTRNGWAVARIYVECDFQTDAACNVIAYPLGAAGSGSTGCNGILSMTSAQNSTIIFGANQVKGSYLSAATLFTITGETAGFQLEVRNPKGNQTTSIADITPYGGTPGGLLTGNWCKIDVTAAVQTETNLAKIAQVPVPYFATTGGVTWKGDGSGSHLAERNSGGSLQTSTDGVNWVNYVTTAGLPFQYAEFGTGATNLPRTPLYGAFAITNVALTSNVATITATTNFIAGQEIAIYGLATTALNGVWTVVANAGSTFTFNLTHANITSTSDSGTASGATLTGVGNGNLQVDSNTSGILVNSLLLVTGEAGASGHGAEANGLYMVTHAGGASSVYVLTRVYPTVAQEGTALPNYQPAQALPSPVPLTVQVKYGASLGGTIWYLPLQGQTVGTTGLTFKKIVGV